MEGNILTSEFLDVDTEDAQRATSLHELDLQAAGSKELFNEAKFTCGHSAMQGENAAEMSEDSQVSFPFDI